MLVHIVFIWRFWTRPMIYREAAHFISQLEQEQQPISGSSLWIYLFAAASLVTINDQYALWQKPIVKTIDPLLHCFKPQSSMPFDKKKKIFFSTLYHYLGQTGSAEICIFFPRFRLGLFFLVASVSDLPLPPSGGTDNTKGESESVRKGQREGRRRFSELDQRSDVSCSSSSLVAYRSSLLWLFLFPTSLVCFQLAILFETVKEKES